MRWLVLVLVVVAAAAAGRAHANGDPASDILPFKNVFLSSDAPESSQPGRDLLELTAAAEKRKFPIRVAVIYGPADLGLISSLWPQPQPYAKFLGEELVAFGRYHGTLVVAMPNGFGVFGPGATPAARRALAALPKPGKGRLDELGNATSVAVQRVAAANGHPLPPPASHSSGTPSWLIALAALAGLGLVAAAAFFVLRRWLTA